MEEKIDIIQLLKDGKVIQFHPQGESMFPLFVSEDDYAVVEPVKGNFKPLEVYVFRSPTGPLVIHRLKKNTKEGLFFIGDRQQYIEGPVDPACVYGHMISYIRRGKQHSTEYIPYKIYSALWMFIRPVRHFLFKIGHLCKIFILKIKGGRRK